MTGRATTVRPGMAAADPGCLRMPTAWRVDLAVMDTYNAARSEPLREAFAAALRSMEQDGTLEALVRGRGF